jgi:Caenorhabditis protein of unknown function, DUF268
MLVTDRTPIDLPFEHPEFKFVQGDALALNIPNDSLDLIINCSTIEHLGLGRYGDHADPNADLSGMRQLQSWLSPAEVVLLTVPVGEDRVYLKAT